MRKKSKAKLARMLPTTPKKPPHTPSKNELSAPYQDENNSSNSNSPLKAPSTPVKSKKSEEITSPAKDKNNLADSKSSPRSQARQPLTPIKSKSKPEEKQQRQISESLEMGVDDKSKDAEPSPSLSERLSNIDEVKKMIEQHNFDEKKKIKPRGLSIQSKINATIYTLNSMCVYFTKINAAFAKSDYPNGERSVKFLEDHKARYIVTNDGQVRVAPEGKLSQFVPPHYLMTGSIEESSDITVLSAGELCFNLLNLIFLINNSSGCFGCDARFLFTVLALFALFKSELLAENVAIGVYDVLKEDCIYHTVTKQWILLLGETLQKRLSGEKLVELRNLNLLETKPAIQITYRAANFDRSEFLSIERIEVKSADSNRKKEEDEELFYTLDKPLKSVNKQSRASKFSKSLSLAAELSEIKNDQGSEKNNSDLDFQPLPFDEACEQVPTKEEQEINLLVGQDENDSLVLPDQSLFEEAHYPNPKYDEDALVFSGFSEDKASSSCESSPQKKKIKKEASAIIDPSSPFASKSRKATDPSASIASRVLAEGFSLRGLAASSSSS